MNTYNYNMKKIYLILLITLSLVGCDGAENKKADYFEKAEQWFVEADYEKTRVELQNVLQIDPKDISARFLLGRALEKLQDYRGASAQYNAILEQDETHVDSRVRLGQFYLLAKKQKQAMEQAEKALQYDSNNANALAFRGSIFLQQGDNVSALADAESALNIEADNLNATLLKATVLNRTNRVNESIETLRNAIDKKPDNVMLRNSFASILSDAGKVDAAIEQIEEIKRQQPDVLFHRLRLADMYFVADDKKKSEETIRDAIKEFPDENEIKISLIKFISAESGEEAGIGQLIQFISEQPANYPLQFVLANYYRDKKNPDKAEGIYKKVIEVEDLKPNGLSARIQLAELYSQTGKIGEAKSLLTEVLAESPNNQTALALRGKIFLSEKDALAAIADFRAAMRDQPNSIVLLRSLANAHLINDEPDLALDLMKRAVNVNETDLVVRQEYIRLLALKGDVDSIVKQLDEVLIISPDNLAAMEALFRVHATQKNWDALSQISKRMIDAHPENAIGYYLSGMQMRAQGKIQESISDLNKAVDLAPNSTEPISQLVQVYLSEKDSESALERLANIISNNTENVFARNLIGEVYLFNKDFDNARNAFSEAIKIKADWYLPYRNLAKIFLLQKENDNAVDILKRGVVATNSSAVLVTDLARYYEATGDVEEAISLYEIVLKENNDNTLAINNLAMLLIDYKGDKDSLIRASKLVENLKDFDNPAYLDTIGWLYYKESNYEKAINYLEKATSLSPDNIGLNYHLGMAYFKQGNKEAARKALTIATQSNEAKYLGFEEAEKTLKSL